MIASGQIVQLSGPSLLVFTTILARTVSNIEYSIQPSGNARSRAYVGVQLLHLTQADTGNTSVWMTPEIVPSNSKEEEEAPSSNTSGILGRGNPLSGLGRVQRVVGYLRAKNCHYLVQSAPPCESVLG